jgi:hypothetical protein
MVFAKHVHVALRRAATVLVVCAGSISFGVAADTSARLDSARIESVHFNVSASPQAGIDRPVQAAVQKFIGGMRAADADTVWMFASEEDQEAFATEQAVYDAFAETFPAFTRAAEVTFDKIWQEGDTPFVELSLRDVDGGNWQATIGLWLDDAGDWKIISCDLTAANQAIASR